MHVTTAGLDATGLCKSYGSRLVLDGLSLSVGAGEVLGLLGPNGAGKTTTLLILATLLRPDAGEIHIAGLSPKSDRDLLRRKLGFVPQSTALYPSLNGLQNLELFARLHGIRKREALREGWRMLREVDLADRAGDPVSVLSGGMQRRLNLACGLVHRPSVLLLDEPAIGVDPQSREQILLTVRRMADAGAAVIYSTHYMEEVERICDRVVLIDRGRVVADGTVAALIALAGRRPRMRIAFRDAAPRGWLDGLSGVKLFHSDCAGNVALELTSLAQVSELLEQARQSGAEVREFSVQSPNLSDAFIALTGHALRDPRPESD
jgi:ABC-2 type transport system ATP-binding protein